MNDFLHHYFNKSDGFIMVRWDVLFEFEIAITLELVWRDDVSATLQSGIYKYLPQMYCLSIIGKKIN